VSGGTHLLTADRGDAGQRLDLVLRRHLTGVPVSRTRVQAWIADGHVSVNGIPVRRAAARIACGQIVAVKLPPNLRERDPGERAARLGAAAPAMQLDVLYEDDSLLVVNKPAGVVVHPAYRNVSGTLMNALAFRAQHWPAPQRPSIVGRLDKLTSGLVVAARSAPAHAALQRAMAAGDTEKTYLAIVYGRVSIARGEIALRLRRDPRDRRRVVADVDAGAPSVTRFERLARVAAPRAGLSLLRCRLLTGRMHQIRVHLAARGWPIVGDPVYGDARWSRLANPALAQTLRTFPRQALHAWRLSMVHPVTGARLVVEAPPPADLRQLLAAAGLSPALPRLTMAD
jgi:23S rRNA pseudouridine1911/1915/1917 synthase